MGIRRLELKAELVRQDLRYRDLAAKLSQHGVEIGEFDIARIVAGRWDPPRDIQEAISGILKRPTFELFAKG